MAKLFSLLFCFVVLIVSCDAGSLQYAQSQKDVVPDGWKKISVCGFSFIVPKSMEDKKVNGIDSCVARFEKSDMSLSIDYGLYSGTYKRYDNRLNFKEEFTEIDGKKAQIVTFIDDSEYARNNPNYKYVAGVHVIESKYRSLNMTIGGKSEKEQQIAKQIFQSIRFQ